jgi:hypothetical protein
MAELHEALKNLSPVSWSDVPSNEGDLKVYLSNAFTAGEIICNSVPPQTEGTPFASATPHHTTPNSATSATEIHPSTARAPLSHPSHVDLQSVWGKPLKSSPKENPHAVSLYKASGKDRHGSWFARRSVHEGIGFDKMRAAMEAEFGASLKAESKKPGAGAIRGLAADEMLDKREVPKVGALQAWLLSAQFPAPTTAREFVAAVCTGSEALGKELSGTQAGGGSAAEDDKDGSVVPRHFMIVSRPLEDHPQAAPRSGYVRAKYESVEMIREIPLSRAGRAQLRAQAAGQIGHDSLSKEESEKSKKESKKAEKESDLSSPTSNSKPADIADDDHDPELNPVEWIMVSRSDPGGGIPRFLVDRGTPEAMLSDVGKFLDWACKWKLDGDGKPEMGAPDVHSTTDNDTATNEELSTHVRPRSVTEPAPNEKKGMLSSLTQAIESNVEAYAPTSVSTFLHSRLHGDSSDSDSSSILSVSSAASFLSASSGQLHIDDPLILDDRPGSSTSNLSLAGKEKLEKHERELQKLLHKREKLNAEHSKHRAMEEAKLRRLQVSASEDAAKRQARRERELEKATEKHRKAVEKLEAKGRKERRKMEAKEEKEREKEEKKAEEAEEKERKKKNHDGVDEAEIRDLKEKLAHAETWRRVVEGRITRALEASHADEKATTERARIAAILEGVDTEVVSEIQRTKLSAPSVTSLSSVKS